jgi:hypothetical protein
MIARVSIKGIWSAVGEDTEASAALAKQKGIRDDVYRAIKKICDPKKIPSLKEFNAARSSLYTLHRQMTLAWDDKAGRMLPSTIYFDYMTKIGDAKQKVIDKYSVFLNDIPSIKAKFQTDPETAGAYREEDWPDVEDLRTKVDIRVRITPLADSSDFRVSLGAEEEAKIKEQVQKDLYSNLAGGLAELVGDIKKVVLDSKASIEGYELDTNGKTVKTFRDSAVTNVRRAVENARKLNVIGDPTLAGLLNDLDTAICQKDPQALRDNYIERQKTVGDVSMIARRLQNIESVLSQAA